MAVFLDRDGVLNEALVRDGRPHPPATVDEVVIRPGVREACRTLAEAGVLLAVVTNQPDLARGTAAGPTSTPSTTTWSPSWGWTPSASARTTTPTAATAASRGPGCW